MKQASRLANLRVLLGWWWEALVIAFIADTGMRLAEGAGLLKSDFIEQDGILCVNIRAHPWRSLKTASSAMIIPIVGSAK